MYNSKQHRQGLYTPVNKGKYIGDMTKIRYLSGWEYLCCRFFDMNPDVEYWSSEETVLPYVCPTDNNIHQYYIDFTVKFRNGAVLLIEVKPKNQTIIPKNTKGKSKKTYTAQVLAFVKNRAKWESADKYATANNAKFVIWTEIQLRKIGLPII